MIIRGGIMEVIGENTKKLIDSHFDNYSITSPLIILGSDERSKSEILQYICEKFGFGITNSDFLAEALLESIKTGGKKHNAIDKITDTALVINEIDFFKERHVLQSELVWFMLKCRCPVVLAVKSYDDFSWEMRKFIGEGKIIDADA